MDSLDIGRYSRQICLPQVGERGQERLTRSRVLVAGCGGLGSVLAFYLAAAGVGRIILVDRDRVEPSNLNRQILYQEAHLGQSKAKTAASTLKALNSGIRVIPVADRLTRRLLAPLSGRRTWRWTGPTPLTPGRS